MGEEVDLSGPWGTAAGEVLSMKSGVCRTRQFFGIADTFVQWRLTLCSVILSWSNHAENGVSLSVEDTVTMRAGRCDQEVNR